MNQVVNVPHPKGPTVGYQVQLLGPDNEIVATTRAVRGGHDGIKLSERDRILALLRQYGCTKAKYCDRGKMIEVRLS